MPLLPSAVIMGLLGLTQIIGYGTTYCCFAIVADRVAWRYGLPASWLLGVFRGASGRGGELAASGLAVR